MTIKKTSRIDVIGSNGPSGLHYTRVCNMCHAEKSLSEFHNSSKPGSSGYQYHCKSCSTAYKQINKSEVKDKTKVRHQKDYRKGLIRAARHRAKNKNISFDIDFNDLKLESICPVFGTPIFSDTLNNPNAPSIDRLVPILGYTKGNVRIISKRANTLKGDASIKEIESILKYMKENISHE